ncbi:MAG: transposase [Verrucomicrobiota bacterium]|nr:transposase [Verrucomicrobiota bacterium]
MITAGTLYKKHFLNTRKRLDYFQNLLFKFAEEYNCRLTAWSILSNHYHFIVETPENTNNLKLLIANLHQKSASYFNKKDNTINRKVWYQFWDKHLTYNKSYLARLNYINKNAVHHGVIDDAESYKWCSAAWFTKTAKNSLKNTVNSFKIDQLKVFDDF